MCVCVCVSRIGEERERELYWSSFAIQQLQSKEWPPVEPYSHASSYCSCFDTCPAFPIAILPTCNTPFSPLYLTAAVLPTRHAPLFSFSMHVLLDQLQYYQLFIHPCSFFSLPAAVLPSFHTSLLCFSLPAAVLSSFHTFLLCFSLPAAVLLSFHTSLPCPASPCLILPAAVLPTLIKSCCFLRCNVTNTKWSPLLYVTVVPTSEKFNDLYWVKEAVVPTQ